MNYFKILVFLAVTVFWINSAFAKILPSGSLTPTFGTNGVVTNPSIGSFDITAAFLASALDSKGNIVLAGSSKDKNGKKHFTLARYTPDGKLDTTFGPDKNGIVILNASEKAGGKVDGEDEIQAMVLQGEKIIV